MARKVKVAKVTVIPKVAKVTGMSRAVDENTITRKTVMPRIPAIKVGD